MRKKTKPKKKELKGYYFIVPKEENGNWSISGIQMNTEGKIIQSVMIESHEEGLDFLDQWGKTLEEYRVITDDMKNFFLFLDQVRSKWLSSFSYRMYRAKLWNIHNEMIYHSKLEPYVTIRELLFLYDCTPPKHPSPSMQICIQLYYLVQCYVFDEEKTKVIMNQSIHELLTARYERHSIEELFLFLGNQGCSISVTTMNNSTFKIKACSASFQNEIHTPSLKKGLSILCSNIREKSMIEGLESGI